MTRIGDTWGSVRGIVREFFSFAQIKDLVGAAGIPVHSLAHIQQKFSGGASKGQLMDAIDGLVAKLEDDDRDRFVVACVAEVFRRNENAHPELSTALSRVGWGISAEGPFPLKLQIDLETTDLSEDVRNAIGTCLARYRDGDFDGAITAICGAVDKLTEEVYASKSLGDPRQDSYQQRVNRAFSSLEAEYGAPLASQLPAEKVKQLWSNHRKAVNQAAYVLGVFRSEFSDAHGTQNAQPEFVQRAIDCAVFIVRSLAAFV